MSIDVEVSPRQLCLMFKELKGHHAKIPVWFMELMDENTPSEIVDAMFLSIVKQKSASIVKEGYYGYIFSHPNLSPKLTYSWNKYISLKSIAAESHKPGVLPLLKGIAESGVNQDEFIDAIADNFNNSNNSAKRLDEISSTLAVFAMYVPNIDDFIFKMNERGVYDLLLLSVAFVSRNPSVELISSIIKNEHITFRKLDKLAVPTDFLVKIASYIYSLTDWTRQMSYSKESVQTNEVIVRNYINYLKKEYVDIFGPEGKEIPTLWALMILRSVQMENALDKELFSRAVDFYS